MRITSVVSLASLGFVSIAGSAFAADLPDRSAPPVFVEPITTGYTVTIGVGPNVLNQFPGSKSITVLPTFHLGYRKVGEPDPFYTPDDAFDISIYENQYFRIGPAANFINNRGLSNGNGNFFGLHNVGNTFEVGGFVEVFPIPQHLRLRGELLKGVTGSKGLVGNVGADFIQRTGPFEVSIGPRIGFGDQRYADQYFTVQPFEAAANGLVHAVQGQRRSHLGWRPRDGALRHQPRIQRARLRWLQPPRQQCRCQPDPDNSRFEEPVHRRPDG